MDIERLKDKISSLPDTCGVYIFKDAQGKIIYVGKAKSLRKRVRSYLNRFLSSKTQALVSKIADIEYKLAPSEKNAQLQEAVLVKSQQPKYNISLKDDKTFPLIRISDEEFPVVSICRRRSLQKREKALYFGPYTDVWSLREAFKVIRRIFSFRSCRKMPKKACLYYTLGLCPGPCIGKINSVSYREIVVQIRMFLSSQYEELLNELYSQMRKASQEKRFEQAAQLRDRINALSTIRQGRGQFAWLELEDLRDLLKLNQPPLRIEAFDISNISGQEATGSMVSFYKGIADKNNYRRFRIKTVRNIDDYGMLKELIRRRYLRLIRENISLPDLILIDGGRVHLLTAAKEIKGLGLEIPLISIAKPPKKTKDSPGGRDRENIYTQDKAYPIRLKEDTPALNLIRRIRDEAHRFAISYHHLLRRKKIVGG